VKVKKSSGMTLVELVAAMAILGMVLVSTSTLILTIVRYNNIMKCKVTNSAIAQKVIECYKTRDFSKLDTIKKNEFCEQCIPIDTKNDNLISKIYTDSTIKPVSKDYKGDKDSYTQAYTQAVNDFPACASENCSNVISVIFTHKVGDDGMIKDNDMIAIDVTVWDSKNKDQCKVEYVTLKGY